MMMSVSNLDEGRSYSYITGRNQSNTLTSHISDNTALNILDDSQDMGSDEEAQEDAAFKKRFT